MGFIIGLSLAIALIVGGAVNLGFRRRARVAAVAGIAAFAASLAWFLHPVCVPIPREDLAGFDPPDQGGCWDDRSMLFPAAR